MNREATIAAARGRVAVGAAALSGGLEGARGVVSFGVCGALDPDLKVGDLLIADAVVCDGERLTTDGAWAAALRAALPAARRGDMAGGEVIVATTAAKAALRRRSGGAAGVDMESHAAARAARAAGVPFAVVRAVSDTASQALPRAAQAGFRADGSVDVGAVLLALAARPWELPALVRTGLDAEKAFTALKIAAAALTGPPD